MVTITAVSRKTSPKTQEEFTVLHLQGTPEVLKSSVSGRPYLSARKSSIPCTLDDDQAKALVGTTLPGSIEKVECEPFEIELPNGKKLKVSNNFVYNPDLVTSEEVEA